MKAIPEMQPLYRSLAPKAQHYYLYIPNLRKGQSLDFEKIFNFDKIQEKSSILIDQSLQKDFGLKSYPVFLLFDSSGQHRFHQIGYDSAALGQALRRALGQG